MRNKKLQLPIFLMVIALFGSLLSLTLPVFTNTASAAGEDYAWVNRDTIKASGGQYKDDVTYFRIGNSNVYSAVSSSSSLPFLDESGCKIAGFQIQVTDNKRNGSLALGGVVNTSNFTCSTSVVDGYSKNLTISNVGRSNTDPGDPAGDTKKLLIIVAVPEEQEFPGNSDRVTLKRNGDQIAQKNTSGTYGPDGVKKGFKVTFDNINPGNGYEACSEKLNECITFRKQPSDVLLPDTHTIVGEGLAAGETPKNCESEGGSLAWILCGFLRIIDGSIGVLADQVELQLLVGEDKYDSTSLQESWKVMRNIALLILVPMMLLMVIGTALEFGPFDAYTVKKALPRMMIAVMFITLSLEITQFFVNLSNVIGRGIEGIVLGATSNPESLAAFYGEGEGGLFTTLVAGGALIGVATGAITLGIVGSLALVTFLALLVGYLVLVVRELLILVLIMLAPLAILVWIFPGNDKMWKIWKTTFTALLMMFPLIILLITSGKVFAGVIDDSQGSFSSFFLKIIAYIAPFFFIPATFKYGLGVFGNLAGVINDRSRGIFDRQKKYREGARANARQQAKMGNRFASGTQSNWRGKLNRGISGGMNAPGAIMASGSTFKPSDWRTATRTTMQNNNLSEVERNMKENQAYQSWMYDDGMNKAAGKSKNASELRALLTADAQENANMDTSRAMAADGVNRMISDTEYRAVEDNVNRVEAVRRSMNGDAFRVMTTRQALAGGTAYKSAGEAWEAAAEAAGNDDAAMQYLVANGRSEGMKAGRIDYAGAGFGQTYNVANKFREQLRATGGITDEFREEQNKAYHKGVYESQGGSSLVHSSMKPGAVEEMAPEMVRTVNEALVGGNEREMSQKFASLAAVYDGMQGSSPGKARIIADRVLSKPINVAALSESQRAVLDKAINVRDKDGGIVSTKETITYQQAIEGLRGEQQFQEMRREYQSQVAAAQQQQLQGQGEPGAPPGQQPGL